jgi:hypothetical protein
MEAAPCATDDVLKNHVKVHLKELQYLGEFECRYLPDPKD